MVHLELTNILEEVQELEILNPVTFIHSLTPDTLMGNRIPPKRRRPMTFAHFTRQVFEPYIEREVMKRFREGQAFIGKFITTSHLKWQNEIVSNANRRMKIQQAEYSKLALSDRMIRAHLTALELAIQEVDSIDSNKDMNIHIPPRLPLAIEPPPQYAAEMAAIILHKEMAPILTKVAQTTSESLV